MSISRYSSGLETVGINVISWSRPVILLLARAVHSHGAWSGPNRTPAPPWIFLAGTVPADFFVLPNSSSFWSHFCAADCKTTKISFETLCCCAELPAKRMRLRGEATRTGFVMFSALEASSSFRKTIAKRRLLCHVAFLRKNKHLSLVPTISD